MLEFLNLKLYLSKIYYFLFKAYMIGSVFVFTILKTTEWNSTLSLNSTVTCGINGYDIREQPLPSRTSVYILGGILIFLCVLAILISFLFVDDYKTEIEMDTGVTKRKFYEISIVINCLIFQFFYFQEVFPLKF
jgi:hypothetical protein